MKIKEIKENGIIFDNGNYLMYYHEQDCCEHVGADFENIQVLTKLTSNSLNSNELDFDENLENYIKKVEGIGFLIEDKNGIKLFVSCYNRQNGYYSSNLELHYGKVNTISVTIDISDCVQDDIY